MYGFGGVGLSEVQISISELSVVGGWWVGGWTGQTHFMVGPGRGPTINQDTRKCKERLEYVVKRWCWSLSLIAVIISGFM